MTPTQADAKTAALTPLQPFDQHNQKLRAHVHPPDWVNPRPEGRYHLVVIGGGTAGLVTAAGAAGLGAKVALVERELLGGDCLNVGCVPSKAVISASRLAAAVRDANEFGVNVPEGWNVDFASVMTRMRRLRAEISPHDSAARFRGLGIDVFLGSGKFTGEDTVEVAGQTLKFKRAVIATGARPARPPIPGLHEAECLTNESIFSLTELPARLVVIGGGPIGAEMAQSFARFGAEVTQVEMARHILSREEPDAAAVVQAAMERDGVRFLLGAKTTRLARQGEQRLVVAEQEGQEVEVVADQVLLGIGRAPNVEDLGLEAVGVDFDPRRGVLVNDRLQTTNRRIFAAGDVCSTYKFTHAADFMARIVIRNALFWGRAKVSKLTIPWTTYTSPELARVGLHAGEAERRGVPIDTFTQPLADVDRARLDGQTEGFARVHVKRGTDQILGATIVAAHAGEMIAEIALAMRHGIGLKGIGDTIHPYPTQAEAVRKLGDQYQRTRLTPLVRKALRKWFAWTR